MTIPQVLKEVDRDRIFYEDSGGGVTFSGGEPLSQSQFVREMLSRCKAEGIHTAVDTCGYGVQADLLALAEVTDLFLYDLKLMDDEKHKQYTGVSNRPILDNLSALSRVHPNIWLRVPIVPGITDDMDNLDAISEKAKSLTGVGRVCLLPYHKTASAKFKRMELPYPLEHMEQPGPERMESLRRRVSSRGLLVTIGG